MLDDSEKVVKRIFLVFLNSFEKKNADKKKNREEKMLEFCNTNKTHKPFS